MLDALLLSPLRESSARLFFIRTREEAKQNCFSSSFGQRNVLHPNSIVWTVSAALRLVWKWREMLRLFRSQWCKWVFFLVDFKRFYRFEKKFSSTFIQVREMSNVFWIEKLGSQQLEWSIKQSPTQVSRFNEKRATHADKAFRLWSSKLSYQTKLH